MTKTHYIEPTTQRCGGCGQYAQALEERLITDCPGGSTPVHRLIVAPNGVIETRSPRT